MSAGTQELYPREGETRFFTFDSGNGDVDTFYRDMLFTGPVGAWADTRKGKFGEYITPRHMYVTNWGTPDEHHVAWIHHAGLQDFEGLEPYSSYHVVCDCAVESEDSALPTDMLECEELWDAVADRAEFWSRQYLIPEVLGALSLQEVDEEAPTPLSVNGQELLMSSMLGFLDMERRHPQKWFGNLISGRLEIETLARLTDQPRDELAPFIAMLQDGGYLESDGQTVKLKVAEQRPAPKVAVSFATSYDEALGIDKGERTKRRMISASRRVQRKIFRTHKY